MRAILKQAEQWPFRLAAQPPLPGMPRKPRDRGYYDLYRGVSLDSSAPGMERIRGILHPYLKTDDTPGLQTSIYDELEPADRNVRGDFAHPGLGPMLLNYIQNSHPGGLGLGRHWSTDPKESAKWAQDVHPGDLHVILRARVPKGRGALDPDKIDVGGYFPSERERTLRPGTNVDVHDVLVRDMADVDSYYPLWPSGWKSVLRDPQGGTA